MRISRLLIALAALGMMVSLAGRSPRFSVPLDVGEWQLTATAINHALDNNDNFSPNDRFLCYDTRETVGGGIGNSTSIMKVEITTAQESMVYEPQPVIVSTTNSAPGVGAASYSPVADEVVFIHGPLVSEVETLGYYGTTNRRAGLAPADGKGPLRFLDYRDVTSDETIPGAHRGGTHRHEFSLDGKRVGFTYDDHLLRTYGRTIGMMVPHPRAPGGVSHYTVLLVPIVPAGTGKPGELERAADDSWIGAKGLMRGFIGQVRQPDGSLMSSLFVVDVPENVDVTTADSGSKTRFPSPPRGVTVRRLTHTPAAGIVRGSEDGTRIGYFATADDGSRQVFLIRSDGSDRDPDPAKRPVQATFLANGATAGLRWHPSGNSIAVLSDNGVAVICVKPGPLFGVAYFISSHGAQYASVAPEALVWSRDGRRLAFNRRVPTYNDQGEVVKDFNGRDFRQIFLVNFPDADGNGIADPIEGGVVRNAASNYAGAVAPESWASVYAEGLAAEPATADAPPLPTRLGGVVVEVTDAKGLKRPALLHAVLKDQVNFIVPAGSAPGPAKVTVTAGQQKRVVPVQIEAVAPGLFCANGAGRGVPVAAVWRRNAQGQTSTQAAYHCPSPGACIAAPIDLGPETDEVVLQIYATGLRGYQTAVTARAGGAAAPVVGAAPQPDYVGLDQVNVLLPRALAGKGEVTVVVTADGKTANPVSIVIR